MKLYASKRMTRIFTSITLLALLTAPVFAQKKTPRPRVLVKNVRVFDGTSAGLTGSTNIVVENNLIKAISAKAKADEDTVVIEGGGRVLIPGLIDAHQHLGLSGPYPHLHNNVDLMWMGISAASEAKAMLMRGFTTVRDAGGPAGGLARAIKAEQAEGPRIYPSGPGIFQAAVQGAFCNFSPFNPNMVGELPVYFPHEFALVASDTKEVNNAGRQALQSGATQISITVGGWPDLPADSLSSKAYTVKEINAAVRAAGSAGTYVIANVFDDASVQRALEAGVVSIEHGTLMSDKTMKLLKEKGAYLVPHARLFSITKDIKEYFEFLGPEVIKKMMRLDNAGENQFKLAVKYKIHVGFGTCLYGTSEDFARQNQEFEFRLKWFTPLEILKQATSINARIIALCGKLNPYPDGPLGVIAPGAYADLLIVDGNPLEDIKVLTDPEKNLKLIMKDGKVYKNTLS